MSYTITREDLPAIAEGAALLGTGGGGDPYIGRLTAEYALAECGGAVTVLTVDELDDDDFVIPTGGMGAPSIIVERPRMGKEPAWALQALEHHLGRRATATMPIECGGSNSVLPIATAAYLGLPLIDADGMGRAFPELQMETFGIRGIRVDPMALATEHHDTVVISSGEHDNARVEWLARGEVISMGGNASMAIYPMTGRQVRETAIAGTFSLCRELGDAMFEACRSHGDPFAAIAGVLDARGQDSRNLCQGKIVDVVRRNERGFVLGSAQIQTSAGDRIDLVFQNENLLLQRLDGAGDPQEVLCSVPDLISVVDETTAQPLTTQMLRYGQQIAVLGIRAPEQLRDAAALEVVGPKCFGLSNEYRPITASIETGA